jgi:hypothetical protein
MITRHIARGGFIALGLSAFVLAVGPQAALIVHAAVAEGDSVRLEALSINAGGGTAEGDSVRLEVTIGQPHPVGSSESEAADLVASLGFRPGGAAPPPLECERLCSETAGSQKVTVPKLGKATFRGYLMNIELSAGGIWRGGDILGNLYSGTYKRAKKKGVVKYTLSFDPASAALVVETAENAVAASTPKSVNVRAKGAPKISLTLKKGKITAKGKLKVVAVQKNGKKRTGKYTFKVKGNRLLEMASLMP